MCRHGHWNRKKIRDNETTIFNYIKMLFLCVWCFVKWSKPKQQQQKKHCEKNYVRRSLLSFSYLVDYHCRHTRNRAAKIETKQNKIIKYLILIAMLIWYLLTVAFEHLTQRLQLSHLKLIFAVNSLWVCAGKH
jgi:hypothetical protein